MLTVLENCVLFSFKCSAVPKITKKERKVIESEKECSAVDRIKFSLRAAYKLFELTPAPEFGNSKWLNASCLWEKRNGLMHPKTPADLELADVPWNKLYDGGVWLIEQLFKFFSLLQEKYLDCPQSGDGASSKLCGTRTIEQPSFEFRSILYHFQRSQTLDTNQKSRQARQMRGG